MGVIEVHGINPFEGQSDPYVTSNGSADDKVFTTDYIFNGHLTGCTLTDLFDKKDNLVDVFDWKEDPTIINNIEIVGVKTATPKHPLTPVSLSFENSNYKGSVGYALTIRWSSGQNDIEPEEVTEYDLMNKTWTTTTDVDEKGCVTSSTSMSCVANSSVPTGCTGSALTAANKWISDNISTLLADELEVSNSLTAGGIDSESLTINPITSEVKYTRRTSSNCDNIKDANAPDPGGASEGFTHCTESTTDYTACEKGYNIITTRHNGEVYNREWTGISDSSWDSLMEQLTTDVLDDYDGIQDFGGSLNTDGSLTYNFTTQLNGTGGVIAPPKSMLVDNRTTSYSTSYDGSTGAKITSSSTSYNGSVFWLNPSGGEGPVSGEAGYSPEDLKKALVSAGKRLTNWSYTEDPIQNTASYSASLNSVPDDEDPEPEPALEGYSGVTSLSVAYTPSLAIYDLVPNMNCDDLVFNMGYVSQGSVTISVSATAGTGYSFMTNGAACLTYLKNLVMTSQGSVNVTNSKVNVAEDDKSATFNYAATFLGANALGTGGNTIKSMY